jgi:hypothetical protein
MDSPSRERPRRIVDNMDLIELMNCYQLSEDGNIFT